MALHFGILSNAYDAFNYGHNVFGMGNLPLLLIFKLT